MHILNEALADLLNLARLPIFLTRYVAIEQFSYWGVEEMHRNTFMYKGPEECAMELEDCFRISGGLSIFNWALRPVWFRFSASVSKPSSLSTRPVDPAPLFNAYVCHVPTTIATPAFDHDLFLRKKSLYCFASLIFSSWIFLFFDNMTFKRICTAVLAYLRQQKMHKIG